jgi:prepilin-type N-terminal cleavage/methylation domain-containing protein
MKRTLHTGFTLVELLVVISIIAILATIAYANFTDARVGGRDAKRQSDVQNLQVAIELYKKQNGRYPVAGCGVSAGSIASESACATYIIGISPLFISVLPRDPLRGPAAGYSYVTNAVGTTFKVMALNTVEGAAVTDSNPQRRCDIVPNGLCTPPSGVCAPGSSDFQTTYAAWGGYADGATDTIVRSNTADIICQ